MTAPGRLFEVITVHCFCCPYTVEGVTPAEAHDAMEVHYDAEHADLIEHIVRTGRP
ncbi:MAG: hypothetical protein ACRDXE_08190 [Acidimicrobiales bacterium]